MVIPLLALVLLALPAAAAAAEEIRQAGEASYYSHRFQGKPTASGERFDQRKDTAASPDLPLGARATVTNEANGQSVDVTINDRGPYVDGRILDVSKDAAKRLGMTKDGTAPVTVEVKPEQQPTEELRETVEQAAKKHR